MFAAAVAVGSSGCDDDSDGSADASAAPAADPVLAPAPTASVNYEQMVTLRGLKSGRSGKLKFEQQGLELTLYHEGLPPGTTVQIGERPALTLEGKKGRARMDAPDLFARGVNTSPRAFIPVFELDEPITIAVPKHKPLQLDGVKEVGISGMAEVFLAVEDGPVLLAGESAEGFSGKEIALVRGKTEQEPTSHFYAVVQKFSMSDIRYVVVTKTGEKKGEKSCKGYDKKEGTTVVGKGEFTIHLHNSEVALYDRVTGEKKASETFSPGKGKCPKQAYAAGGIQTVDLSKIKSWARKHRR